MQKESKPKDTHKVTFNLSQSDWLALEGLKKPFYGISDILRELVVKHLKESKVSNYDANGYCQVCMTGMHECKDFGCQCQCAVDWREDVKHGIER
jgi:hypothetical protein